MRTSVSLVATVKNEGPSIENFLTSLLAQSRAPDEIVIVDGGSSDGTLQILRATEETVGQRFVVLHAPGANIAVGRNVGIEKAAGAVIAVTDAGTRLEPNWLERLIAPLESDEETAVSAGFYRAFGTTWFERTLGAIITPQLEEIDPARFDPSSRSVAFRKEWWRLVGGYPEWLRHSEDLCFDFALRDAGARFAFAPDAIVFWTARSNLREFFSQYFAYARGDGNARFWPSRHLARYSAYGLGAALAVAAHRRPLALGALLLGMSIHFRRFAVRLVRHPPHANRTANALAFAALPLIVVTGDIAKMTGYPVGRFERATGRIAVHCPRETQ